MALVPRSTLRQPMNGQISSLIRLKTDHLNMERVLVDFTVDSYSLNAQLLCSLYDATGNFTSITLVRHEISGY